MNLEEIEPKLRQLLFDWPFDAVAVGTRDICAALLGENQDPAFVKRVYNLGRNLLAEHGPPDPKRKAFGRVRRPLVWRRIGSPEMPVAPAYLVAPSKLTRGDAVASLAPSYSGRKEPGTFGPASSVRNVYDELDDLRAQVAMLFQMVAHLGEQT